MKYSHVRQLIKSGDVALVSGNNLFSFLVRLFTSSAWSHVAVFFYEDDALFISEVKEFRGHRITHASTWIDEQLTSGKHVKIGMAPERVRNQAFVTDFIEQHRSRSTQYAFWLLPFVWLSNVTGIALPGKALVCSVYVQKCWKHAGRALLPRDFARLCDKTYTIRRL